MEIEQGKMVAMICKEEKTKEKLIELLSGKNTAAGNCTLNHISMGKSIIDYKKKVDYINPRELSSELTVRNYLIFYGMVSGVYYEGMVDEFTDMLAALQMEEILDKKVNELSYEQKILVRGIAARLKKVELLLGNYILENRTADEQRNILDFLKQYFVKKFCVCVLFEKNISDVEQMIHEVIVIEDLMESKK